MLVELIDLSLTTHYTRFFICKTKLQEDAKE